LICRPDDTPWDGGESVSFIPSNCFLLFICEAVGDLGFVLFEIYIAIRFQFGYGLKILYDVCCSSWHPEQQFCSFYFILDKLINQSLHDPG